jgi:polyisoprenoid-binding protein YceI
MRMTLHRAAAAFAVVAIAGSAAAQSMPSPDPETVQAGTYAVEPYHTRVLFDVLHMGFTHYYGNVTLHKPMTIYGMRARCERALSIPGGRALEPVGHAEA